MIPTTLTPAARTAAMHRAFHDDVLAGLRAAPKCIPSKHIYDARGSELFEQITKLDEYYLTRVERDIFDEHLADMAAAIGPHATIIEPGAGSGEKAATLLRGLDEPRAYVPIEISQAALKMAIERIATEFPEVKTQPVCADFTADVPISRPQSANPIVFFPGSTIGNFEPPGRMKLLNQFAQLVGTHGMVLIGFDLIKPLEVLLPAYDDAQGVTAEFNTNLLHRINRELAGDFDVDQFDFVARWNAALECVEGSQRSRTAQTVTVAGESFNFQAGEHLRTERSHKFTLDRMDSEAAHAGFRRIAEWTDRRRWFCVGLYQR